MKKLLLLLIIPFLSFGQESIEALCDSEWSMDINWVASSGICQGLGGCDIENPQSMLAGFGNANYALQNGSLGYIIEEPNNAEVGIFVWDTSVPNGWWNCISTGSTDHYIDVNQLLSSSIYTDVMVLMRDGDQMYELIPDSYYNMLAGGYFGLTFSWNNMINHTCGCINEIACNYNADAVNEDDSCDYPEVNYDCDGNCVSTVDCAGVCGGNLELDDCGTCDNDATNDCVLGCSDIYAWNFAGVDFVDDGSCCYYTCCDGMGGYLEGCVEGCMNSSACNYNPEATTTCWFGADGDGICCDYPEEGVNCDGQQLTYVPDDGFEFKLILLGYDDVMDNYVITDNISVITNLQMNYQGTIPSGWNQIEDLIGIEDFISLTNLNVYNHSLTSIDLSNNLLLQDLDCSNNDALSSLNISQCSFLQDLDCSEGILTELDLTGNPFLQQLACNNNLLAQLDVSQNSFLQELDCGYNSLVELDVTENTALQILYAESNQITSIDVSQNLSLERLILTDNYLLEIDVSQNNLLIVLKLNNNYLQELDISQNTLLGMTNESILAQDNLINCINVWSDPFPPNEPGYSSGFVQKDEWTIWSTDCDYALIDNPCDTIYVDNFVVDTIVETEYVDVIVTDTLYVDNFVYVTDTLYIDGVITDTLYVDNFIIDTITIEVPIVEYDTIIEIQYLDTLYVDNFIIDTIVETEYVDIFDTIIQTEYITDTIFETEYVDVIITEYIDCDTGLPCSTAIDVLIDKSKTDGKIYNLLGQEINRREGIYIEGGEVKYRLQ